MSEPRTEAGRKLLADLSRGVVFAWSDPPLHGPDVAAERIRAIEQEAGRLDVDRLAEVMEQHAWDIDCGSKCAPQLAREYAALTEPRPVDDASEYGRLLAERDRLIGAGVDPADLEMPQGPA